MTCGNAENSWACRADQNPNKSVCQNRHPAAFSVAETARGACAVTTAHTARVDREQRRAAIPAHRVAKPKKLRARVEFSDAAAVTERVRSHAATLGLRGSRRLVLAAVLTMLCAGTWSKITDDQMRLRQLVNEITAAGGRRYDLKTIGRALASLAADELIVYRPAQGRGKHAFIAIHDQFVSGVEVLERDRSGQTPATQPDGARRLLPQQRSTAAARPRCRVVLTGARMPAGESARPTNGRACRRGDAPGSRWTPPPNGPARFVTVTFIVAGP